MISLNDVLLAMSNIPVDDPIAEIWGRGLQGGYRIIEYTGSLPITINANGDALIDYRIYGIDGGVGEVTENLFDPNAKNVDNGYVAQSVIGYPNGNISSAYWAYVTEYIPVDSNTNYVMFMNLYRAEYTDGSRGLAFYDENKDFISVIRGCTAINEVTYENPIKGRISFTTPENCRYIRTNVDVNATMLMLVAASTPPPAYIPYGYKLPMTVQSANLFDEHSPSIPGSIQSDGNIYSKGNAKTYDYMIVESNTRYRLKAFEHSESYDYISRIAWYDENKEFLYRDYRMQGYEILSKVSPTNAKYCRISIDNGLSKCVLIKESAMPMEYIPYSKQTIPVYIGDTPLDEGEYVSYGEQKIYKDVDGILTPTDPPVPLPAIPTVDGVTVIDCELETKPDEMYVKYIQGGR